MNWEMNEFLASNYSTYLNKHLNAKKQTYLWCKCNKSILVSPFTRETYTVLVPKKGHFEDVK